MKRIIILLFLLCNFVFAGNIKGVKQGGSSITFQLTQLNNSDYEVNYDSYNRLIFVEFPKSQLSTKVNSANFNSKYVEKFQVVNYPQGTGFFIKLKKNITYRTSHNSREFTLSFNGKSSKKQYTIVIDAGHGGKDSGAVGFDKYYEKNVVLSVAKYLKDELKGDFNIVMTRDRDVFVTLGERPRIANKVKADLFVSVHANSALTNKLSGTEVFYFSKKSSPYAERIASFENSVGDRYGEKTNNIVQIMGELSYKKNQEVSIRLAKQLSAGIARGMNMKDRGIHGANFAVLRGFNGPGVLIELGFINNSSDINKLINSSNQKRMAKEIAKVIKEKYY